MELEQEMSNQESKAEGKRNSLLRKLEMFLYFMVLVGLVFWKMHWPFGGMFLMLSLGLLSVLYFFGFTMLINKIPGRKFLSREGRASKSSTGIVVGIVAGILLQTSVLGLLFGIMGWPMWGTFCTIGAPMAILLGLIGAGFMAKKENEFGLPLMKRSVLLAVGCFMILLFHVEIEAERYGVMKSLFYDIHECLESGEAHCQNDKEILYFTMWELHASDEGVNDALATAKAKMGDLAVKYGYEITWGDGVDRVDYQPVSLNRVE